MEEVVILDDSMDAAPSTQTRMSLTQEQRERIAKQKELALARRSAKEHQITSQSHLNNQGREESKNGGASPGQSFFSRQGSVEIIDVGERLDGKKSAFEYHELEYLESQKRRHLNEGQNAMELGNATREWRSVRKRPAPGQSFGRVIKEHSFDDTSMSSGEQQASLQNAKAKSINSNHSDSLLAETISNKNKFVVSGATEANARSEGVGEKKQKVALSIQQLKILKALANRKSVFVTGSAGTGKSYLLEFAVLVLRRIHGSDSVFVTASTGLAACALGGTTVHSFSGIGLGMGAKEALVDKIKSKREVRKRWMTAKALIIDEISMIDGELFDKLEYAARAVRGSLGMGKVFGGLQLVVTGDFFQLPPVSPENQQKYFAFQADCWNRCFDLQIELTHVFRQSDSEFVAMLNELRVGYCSPTTRAKLEGCTRPVDSDTGIVLTRLYPRKLDVGRENEQKLMSLNQETVTFLAKDDGRNEFAKRQLENLRAEKLLSLSVGAQVMLVKNLETNIGLVNGARGVVVKFISADDPAAAEVKNLAKSVSPAGLWPVVRFACDGVERVVGPESWSVREGDHEVAKRSQVPLILAWALSVHKCQGMTLDRVETDLSKAFEYGMVYVALSRVKSMEGLQLLGFDPSRIKVHPEVVKFYDGLKNVS